MLDLPSLAPKRFKLDTARYRWNNSWPWTWGLMLRKWFEHGGCIDLDKIAEYIRACKRFKGENNNFSTSWIKWQLAYQRTCKDDKESYQCPPPPEAPKEPILKNYKTDKGDTCPLSEVLGYEFIEDLTPAIRVKSGYCAAEHDRRDCLAFLAARCVNCNGNQPTGTTQCRERTNVTSS